MTRAQIVIDEELLHQAKAEAKRTGRSFSELVREALSQWLARREPDLSWMGTLSTPPEADHRWSSIRETIELGMAQHRTQRGDGEER